MRVGVSTPTASQQGHLAATCSLNPRVEPSNSHELLCGYDTERVRDRARRHAVAPALCRVWYQALVNALVSLPPSGSSGPGGRAVSGGWSREAVRAACRPRLTSFPNFCRFSWSW